MQFQISTQGEYQIVLLSGDVDMHSSPNARQVILSALEKAAPLLVDLSAVTYIDSSGIASLVEGYQLAKKKGQKFALLGVGAAVMNVLKLARLDRVFVIHNSLEECRAGGG